MDARPYHHGALRPALLEVAETMLERDGLEHLSLRAIARTAGVSHAAPAHHFGDLRGMLTALATIGFERFAQLQQEAAAASENPLRALGRGYVQFARAHPALFTLMFHHKVLNAGDPDFQAATEAAFSTLANVTQAGSGQDTPDGRAKALASWCLVHGFAMLLLDGRLPDQPDPEILLEHVFAARSSR